MRRPRSWVTLVFELSASNIRSGRAAPTTPAVLKNVEVILLLAGNPRGLVRRNVGGLIQEGVPKTGALWLRPAGGSDATPK
jgi:AraC family transcriptional regulator